MLNHTSLIKVAARSSGLREAFEKILGTTTDLEIMRSGDTRRPDLLIFELNGTPEKDFSLIRSLLEENLVGDVFLTSENFDQAILLEAMRTGAKEFFFQPLKEEEVIQAVDQFRSRRQVSHNQESSKLGQIINVIGSKGGIGTTTLAVNLALNLAERKDIQSVALLDMNLLFGEIPLFLSFLPQYNWGEITKDISRLDPTFLMGLLSRHSSGVYVLPSPTHMNGNGPPTPEVMERLLSLMQGMFDFVVIDGGQPINDSSVRILEMSSQVLLVSLLSLPCLSNVSKLLSPSNLGFLPKERVKVVISRCMKNSDISLKDAEKTINRPIFWTLPNDYKATMSAINQGKGLSQVSSGASITKSLKGLTDAMITGEEKQEKSRWKFLK